MKQYKQYKHYVVLLADILIVFIAFFFAIYVNDDFHFILEHYVSMSYELPFTMVIYIVIFEVTGMYKSLWKYASIEELIRGVIANLLAINFSYLILLSLNLYHFNYSYYLIAFFFVSTGTIGVRMSYRFIKFYKMYIEDTSYKMRTLIVGAGHAGVTLLDEINENNDFMKKVIGFIDDDLSLEGKQLRGVPVLGTLSNIREIAYQNGVDSIILAVPSLSFAQTRSILNTLEDTGCKIKMMQPFYEMVGTKQEIMKIRDVKIEDLLGREPIVLEETGIRNYVNGKTIVVTGGGGSIGSELVRQLRHFNPSRIIIIDIYENNAYDLQQELCRMYSKNEVKHKPEIIVLIASVRDRKRIDEIWNI